MIYITGDTHGDFKKITPPSFCGKPGDSILICGDFGGVWDGSAEEEAALDGLAELPYDILFVDGNHENFDLMNALPVSSRYGGKVRFVRRNVIHLMRGQAFDIEGFSFFTMGGGSCHDVSGGIYEPDDPCIAAAEKRMAEDNLPFRINHVSWWTDELPNDAEYDEAERSLSSRGYSFDFIVTHCAPTHIQDVFSPFPFPPDRLTDYLSGVAERCVFRKWFFGHYHQDSSYGEKYELLFDSVRPISDFV